MHIDPIISNRIKKAWSRLDSNQRSMIMPFLSEAHNQALSFNKTLADHKKHLSYIMFAKSIIEDDPDQLIHNFKITESNLGEYGEIWGTGKYEQLDAGWVEIVACWLETFVAGTATFNDSYPSVLQIPDDIKIAIAGDWGTGDWRSPMNPAPCTNVKNQILRLAPDVTIHLGDVYYAGTHEQEVNIMLDHWPRGSSGSVALNSNHEMYSGGKNYFGDLLNNPMFSLQDKKSFFVLENSNWIIVGLDSAYFADPYSMYRDGAIYVPNSNKTLIQLRVLSDQIKKNKKIIVLTHHNGMLDDGSDFTTVGKQVMGPFLTNGKIGPDYWYWGHAHIGAVYKTYGPFNGYGTSTMNCRCTGHAAVPWGFASKLANNPNVKWFESNNAHDSDIPLRVNNGFTVLQLNNDHLKEQFYNELGQIVYEEENIS